MNWLRSRPPLPIRLWLQSTGFTAVLAGYALLVAANHELLELQSQREHQDRVERLRLRLESARADVPLPSLLEQVSAPDLLAWSAADASGPAQTPSHQAVTLLELSPALRSAAEATCRAASGDHDSLLNGENYALSCRRITIAGQPRRMVFVEDHRDHQASVHSATLLMAALAGVAALFTNALMRLVLRMGLRPLAALIAELDQISPANLAQRRLAEADQPAELVPIARAFNQLLDRLNGSFEHQRAFANAVAHELRTPITLIGGYANRLQRRVANLTAPQRQQLELIHTEASHMGRLVSDLLEIARDDADQLEVRREPCDAAAALVAVHQRLAGPIGSRLQLTPLPSGPLAGLGDGERLQQCLANLIENAVKYAPGGTPIELAASRAADGAVVLHVRDHGPGVADAEKQRIFERFVRGSVAAGAAQPGSGIGLAVVQALMRRMGGSVKVADAPGGGADFQLRLEPLAGGPQPGSSPASSASTPASSSVFST